MDNQSNLDFSHSSKIIVSSSKFSHKESNQSNLNNYDSNIFNEKHLSDVQAIQPKDQTNNVSPAKVPVRIVDSSVWNKIFLFSSILGNNTHRASDEKERMSFWSELFFNEHVNPFHQQGKLEVINDDDCLYFVYKSHTDHRHLEKPFSSEGNNLNRSKEERFFVRRRYQENAFPSLNNDLINWEETFFLNVILHHFQYKIVVSIRKKEENPSPKGENSSNLFMQKKIEKTVYASPSKVRMDLREKAEAVEHTYPLLYFSVNDFSETWKDLVLSQEGELICVELFAVGSLFPEKTSVAFNAENLPNSVAVKPTKIRLFAGALSYEVIKREYGNKRTMWSSSIQFFHMQGPKGKGSAQMAVLIVSDNSSTSISDNRNDIVKGWSSSFGIKLGNVLKIPFGWNSSQKEQSSAKLNCQLTYLNLHWTVLVNDLLEAYQKLPLHSNDLSSNVR